MPYGEQQPDGSVNVYDDNGNLMYNETWEQNQGLPAPAPVQQQPLFQTPQFPTQNVAPTDLLAQQIALLHEKYLQTRLDQLEIPEMQNRTETDRHGLAINAALNFGQQLGYTVDPRMFAEYMMGQGFGTTGTGGPGGTGSYQTVNGPRSIDQMRDELVRASGGMEEWRSAPDDRVISEYGSVTGGPVTATAVTGAGAAQGGATYVTPDGQTKTLDQMRQELGRHHPDWLTKPDQDVLSEYNKLSGGQYALQPPGAGTGGVGTQAGGLDALFGRPTFEREQWAANLQANPRNLVEGLLAMGLSPQQAVSTLQQSPLYQQLVQPWFDQPGMTGWNPQQPDSTGYIPPTEGGFTGGPLPNNLSGTAGFPTNKTYQDPNQVYTFQPDWQRWDPQTQYGISGATQPGGSQLPTGPSGFSFVQGQNLPVRQTLQDIQGNSSRVPLYSSLASFSGQNPDMFWGQFTGALPKGGLQSGSVMR
jgi:hypothetical protein